VVLLLSHVTSQFYFRRVSVLKRGGTVQNFKGVVSWVFAI